MREIVPRRTEQRERDGKKKRRITARECRRHRETRVAFEILTCLPSESVCVALTIASHPRRSSRPYRSRPDDPFSQSSSPAPSHVTPPTHPLFRPSSQSREVEESERSRPVDDISSTLRHNENDLPRNSYYCVLDDFRLFIFYLLCKIYNTNSILETVVCRVLVCSFVNVHPVHPIDVYSCSNYELDPFHGGYK